MPFQDDVGQHNDRGHGGANVADDGHDVAPSDFPRIVVTDPEASAHGHLAADGSRGVAASRGAGRRQGVPPQSHAGAEQRTTPVGPDGRGAGRDGDGDLFGAAGGDEQIDQRTALASQ